MINLSLRKGKKETFVCDSAYAVAMVKDGTLTFQNPTARPPLREEDKQAIRDLLQKEKISYEKEE